MTFPKSLFTLVAAFGVGCAPASYVYTFDLTDPGAHNLTRPGERDTIEDADVKAELLVDPTSFQAILLELTNKTGATLDVDWQGVAIVGADHVENRIRPDNRPDPVEPGAKIVTRLVPFVLPEKGPAAAGYEGATFELVVPVLIGGKNKVYRYHLLAHVNKL